MNPITITIKPSLYRTNELTKRRLLKERQLKIFVYVVKFKSKMNPIARVLAQLLSNLTFCSLFSKKIPLNEAEGSNLSHWPRTLILTKSSRKHLRLKQESVSIRLYPSINHSLQMNLSLIPRVSLKMLIHIMKIAIQVNLTLRPKNMKKLWKL